MFKALGRVSGRFHRHWRGLSSGKAGEPSLTPTAVSSRPPRSPLKIIRSAQVFEDKRNVSIEWEDGKKQVFDWFWLRDNTPAEIHSQSSQRLTITEKIPLDGIHPLSVNLIDGNVVEVAWSDNSKFSYSTAFLRQHADRATADDENLGWPTSNNVSLWNGATFGEMDHAGKEARKRLPGISYEELMWSSDNKENPALEHLMDLLYKWGFAVVWDTPHNVKDSRAACERLGHCRSTMFGDFWDLTVDSNSSKGDFSDTAYTPLGIAPHTDGTYLNDPPGLQSFHILHHRGDGGLNSLIDGWQISKLIKEHVAPAGLNPWQFLTKHPMEFYYADTNSSFRHKTPIISLNDEGHVQQFRWNNHDRLPPHPSISAEKLREYHYSVQLLQNLIEDPANQVRLKLVPGMLLITNGWRVLHGRTAMTGSRRLIGCYINYDDYLSRRRVLKRRQGDLLQLY